MGRIRTGFTIVLIFFTLVAFSQQKVKKDSAGLHKNHYSFTFGTGWTHFYNNLENGDQDIQKDFMGYSGKFFWEPEYRLSLGLETGYYMLFRVKNQLNNDTSVQISRTVVPLLLLVRMRIVDNFYLGAGMGIAILTTKASGPEQKIVTKANSLSNFEVSASYVYPLSKHWNVGGEFKVFSFAKLNDWMYSIQATCAFRL
jgi:hypothetical protein